MSRTRQKKKPSEWTYLPPSVQRVAIKNYSKETAEGPYWKPWIDYEGREENPVINWMTFKDV